MKKKILFLVTILLFAVSIMPVCAEKNEYIPNISMKISSNCIITPDETIELDEVATLKNGRSYFPLRGIAEYYGIKVDYVNETQTIILKDSYLEARLQPGNDEMIVSYGIQPIPSRIIKLDAPAYISENGRTMLPIRAVAEEVFGCEVEWNGEENMVTLYKDYQTKRLIVKAVSEGYKYNLPDVTVSDGDLENVSFIEFSDKTPDGVIRYYCHQLSANDDIVYAVPDRILHMQLS